MSRKIQIFDTTLRDGEQSPGASMNTQEKLNVTRQLLRLGVDVIEAGFPVSSPGDFKSVQQIAEVVGDKAVVCGLTRAVEKDIDVCADALKNCPRPRIHTGIGVSPEHLKYKFRGMSLDEAIERGVAAVKHARKYVEDVEFYAEDAGRASFEDLAKMIEAAIAAGATVVNIPDTTGYNMPWHFGERIKYLCDHVKGIENATISVHCHNDLGCATALALEGVRNGAAQVECTINGLGERAGNTAMEEIVMAIKMHEQELGCHTDSNSSEFLQASRLVSSITGMPVQANKATQISCGQPLTPTATVTLLDPFGNERTACDFGTGPVDALFKAIDKIIQAECELNEFSVQSVTRGIDALGEVTIRITAADGTIYSGRGSECDITVSSAKAYVNALNRMLQKQA